MVALGHRQSARHPGRAERRPLRRRQQGQPDPRLSHGRRIGRSRSEDEVFARGLHQPYGIAFYPLGPNPEWVYVANTDSVVRFPYKDGDLRRAGKPETLVDDIPIGHHWTRDVAFSPDGKQMYVSVGSGSNIAEQHENEARAHRGLRRLDIRLAPRGAEERRADVLAFDPDGNNERSSPPASATAPA